MKYAGQSISDKSYYSNSLCLEMLLSLQGQSTSNEVELYKGNRDLQTNLFFKK